MAGEVRVVFFLLDDLDLLGEVLRIGVAEEIAVGGLAEPVVAGLELVGDVLVVLFLGVFLDIFVGVGGPAAQREVSASVSISGFYVLIVSSVAGELRRVRAQLGARTIAVQEVLRVGSLDVVALVAGEAVGVGRPHLEMRALESVVLFVVVYDVGDGALLVETALIDGVLGQVGFDDVHFAEVASTVAVRAYALVGIVMREVCVGQFGCGFVEDVCSFEAVLVIMEAPLGFGESIGIYRCMKSSEFEFCARSTF